MSSFGGRTDMLKYPRTNLGMHCNIGATITAPRIGSLCLGSSDTDVQTLARDFKGQHRCPIDHTGGSSPGARSLQGFPALKRRYCGASQCISNFGPKFAGRLNSI